MNNSDDAAKAQPPQLRVWVFAIVVAQFVLAAAIFLTLRWSPFCIVCYSIAAVGALIAIWAWITMGLFRLRVIPNPSKHAVLLEHGPYRFIRHPMYSGLLIAALGLVLTNPAPWRIITWLALVIVLVIKTRHEEPLLLRHFDNYHEYQSRTWRFIPLVY
jgi:protein-S-isoprenylcysteine O-methyltransferase Ste14